MYKNMTRRDFLRMAGFGALAIFILPGIKRLNFLKRSYKEARYYKALAG